MATDVNEVVLSEQCVLTAVSHGLSIISRSGIIQATVKGEAIKNSKTLSLNPITSGRHVCLGGDSKYLSLVDTEISQIIRQSVLRGPWKITKSIWNNTMMNCNIFSTSTGRVSICDPSTLKEMNAIATFTDSITSMYLKDYYLMCTGLVSRNRINYLEQNIKIYDIRQFNNP